MDFGEANGAQGNNRHVKGFYGIEVFYQRKTNGTYEDTGHK
jgi:hypothetical protein